MLDKLPDELQLLVLDHLSPRNKLETRTVLEPLSLVCRRLRHNAQHVLFSNIIIRIVSLEVAQRLLTQTRRTELLSKVRAFDIDPRLGSQAQEETTEACLLVLQLLALFRNAREGRLVLVSKHRLTVSPSTDLRFDFMTKLKVHYEVDEMTSDWLTNLLTASPNLRKLVIHGQASLPELPKTAVDLPKLVTLSFCLRQPQSSDMILWPCQLIAQSSLERVTSVKLGSAQHSFHADDQSLFVFQKATTLVLESPYFARYDKRLESDDNGNNTHNEFACERAFDLSRFSAYKCLQNLNLMWWSRTLSLADILPILPPSVRCLTLSGRPRRVTHIIDNLRWTQVNRKGALERVEVNWVVEGTGEIADELLEQCWDVSQDARLELKKAGVALIARGTVLDPIELPELDAAMFRPLETSASELAYDGDTFSDSGDGFATLFDSDLENDDATVSDNEAAEPL